MAELELHESTKLNGMLIAAGIIPLNRTKVQEHMDIERRKVPYTPGARVLGPLVNFLYIAVEIFSITSGLTIFFGAVIIFLSSFNVWPESMGIGAGLILFGVVSKLLGLLAESDQIPICIRMPAQWKEAHIPMSTPYVPAAVESIADKVTHTIPDATIVTHKLQQDRVTFDPILEVRRGSESEFLAIWERDKVITIG